MHTCTHKLSHTHTHTHKLTHTHTHTHTWCTPINRDISAINISRTSNLSVDFSSFTKSFSAKSWGSCIRWRAENMPWGEALFFFFCFYGDKEKQLDKHDRQQWLDITATASSWQHCYMYINCQQVSYLKNVHVVHDIQTARDEQLHRGLETRLHVHV